MVLLDVDLGPERAVDFVLEAKKKGFEGQILVVTAGVSGPEATQLIQAGVVGILQPGSGAPHWRRARLEGAGPGIESGSV